MSPTLRERLDALGDTVFFAGSHFAVWETIQESRPHQRDVDAMNRYAGFFQATQEAHSAALVVPVLSATLWTGIVGDVTHQNGVRRSSTGCEG